MIETNGPNHVFHCGIPGCPYERLSADREEVQALSSWHTFEQHRQTWINRMGAHKLPKLRRPADV